MVKVGDLVRLKGMYSERFRKWERDQCLCIVLEVNVGGTAYVRVKRLDTGERASINFYKLEEVPDEGR